MNEQAEKLAEEIADEIARLWLERIPQLATLDEVEEQERILARELITRIGKACADGMPLPGEEVVRFDFSVDDWGRFENWVAQALHEDASIFIALSPSGIPAERKEGK